MPIERLNGGIEMKPPIYGGALRRFNERIERLLAGPALLGGNAPTQTDVHRVKVGVIPVKMAKSARKHGKTLLVGRAR